jgi:hypothetical protein
MQPFTEPSKRPQRLICRLPMDIDQVHV